MLLKPHLVTLTLGALTLIGCNPPPPQLVPPEMRSTSCSLPTESYRVYDAVMEDFGARQYPGWFDRPNLVVLDVANGRGVRGSFWRANKKSGPASDTLAAFNNLFGCSCTIAPPSDSVIHYTLVSEAELHTIFAGGVKSGWTKFYQLYSRSHGYWDLSPVGFNKSGDEALVSVGHHCGGLCGAGYCIVLRRKGGRWSVISESMSWVS